MSKVSVDSVSTKLSGRWRETISAYLGKLSSLRFLPTEKTGRIDYDDRLDGLRGFAAWSVMVVHGFGSDGWPLSSGNEYVRHLHLSRAAVFLFFITSGYVIGLTNRQPFSWHLAKEYLRRRCLRIVPIYVLAVTAGWLVIRDISGWNLISNFLFLQNPAWNIEPLAGNLPVWSLHNEVVYYLGFVVLWALRPKVAILMLTMAVLALVDWFYGGSLSFLGGWSVGALFWLAGLLLAWNRTTGGNTPVIAFLLLTYGANHFWPGVIMLNGLGFPYAGESTVRFADLALLPGAIVVFCGVINLTFPGLKLIRWLAVAIPVVCVLLLLLLGRLFDSVPWTLSCIATIVALPLIFLERRSWGVFVFRLFKPLGGISYGLYLLHVPCAELTNRFYPWTGGILNYIFGVCAWLATTVILAWICEHHLQPTLVAYYKRRKNRLAQSS